MMKLEELSDEARVWIFGAERALRDEEQQLLRETMGRFLAGWSAHKVRLRATAEVLHDRFLVVALDQTSSTASGCSIDSLFRQVDAIEKTTGLRLLDSTLVFFADGAGNVQSTDRAGFRALALQGVVKAETPVYDPTVTTLGEVRAGWPGAAGSSWHKQLLG